MKNIFRLLLGHRKESNGIFNGLLCTKNDSAFGGFRRKYVSYDLWSNCIGRQIYSSSSTHPSAYTQRGDDHQRKSTVDDGMFGKVQGKH